MGAEFGCSGEQGLIVIRVRMENRIADGMELKPRSLDHPK